MYEELIKKCEEQEKRLRFSAFKQTDALELGKLLYKKSLNYEKPVAIEIRYNHLCVFRFFSTGTNKNNELWLRAKANTVDMLGISSLHLYAELMLSGEKLKERRMNPEEYAACGGGFPLVLENSEVVGSICVSGLEHSEDHQVIIDALEEYLKK